MNKVIPIDYCGNLTQSDTIVILSCSTYLAKVFPQTKNSIPSHNTLAYWQKVIPASNMFRIGYVCPVLASLQGAQQNFNMCFKMGLS